MSKQVDIEIVDYDIDYCEAIDGHVSDFQAPAVSNPTANHAAITQPSRSALVLPTPKQDNSPLAGALVHPARIGRTAQVIRAVLAWQDGQQEPLADLVEDLMQADEARRLLAQRGYGRESQALPELAEATPALWW